jgi:hypothetical protein
MFAQLNGGVELPMGPRLGTFTGGTNLLPSTRLVRILEPFKR